MKEVNDLEMSNLEKELELEMDEDGGSSRESSSDTEFEGSYDPESEAFAFEGVESEFEDVEGEGSNDYGERFYELSQRQFESESEADNAVNGLLNEMERDYFWGKLKRLAKKGFKWGLKNLVKKGLSFAKGLPVFKAIQGATQLARGNLKGFLGSLAKSALGAGLNFIPGGGVARSALSSLGFGESEAREENLEAWNNFAAVAREAYGNLADNLHEGADDPVEASRLASNAFESALKNVQQRGGANGERKARIHRIRVRAGQKIKLIIEGV